MGYFSWKHKFMPIISFDQILIKPQQTKSPLIQITAKSTKQKNVPACAWNKDSSHGSLSSNLLGFKLDLEKGKKYERRFFFDFLVNLTYSSLNNLIYEWKNLTNWFLSKDFLLKSNILVFLHLSISLKLFLSLRSNKKVLSKNNPW